MIKRILDLFLIFIFSPFLIFIFLFTSAIIYLFDGMPIIFRQQRIGLHCKKFIIYKFRTMKQEALENNNSEKERITSLGRFLRLFSFDEIPSIYNVLRGEMSLVGPRPLLPEYLKYYTKFQNKRHNVKPGLTGYAQIKGRNKLKWSEKFKLDVYYVENQNLLFDLKILFLTFFKLLQIKDNQYGNNITMYKFRGKKDE